MAYLFRFSLALVRAIEASPKSQVELGAPFNLRQSHLSRMLHGETFGDVVRERVDALGASLGVAASSVPADLPERDEALVEELGSWSVVFDRVAGIASVVNDDTGEFLSFPNFRERVGARKAERWLSLPPEARRTYPTANDWRRAQQAKKGGAR